MSKLLKINVLCIVISMLINIFPDIVGAEDYLWGNRNSSEMFNVDDYITSAEEIDNDNENDYVEPYKQFLIKYIDNFLLKLIQSNILKILKKITKILLIFNKTTN